MGNQSSKLNTVGRSASSKSAKLEKHSTAEWLASLPDSERQRCLSSLSDEEKAVAAYDWRFWARPSQLEPAGPWVIWLILTGRGFGKTRTGAEWIRERVDKGLARSIVLIAKTPADARDTMIEGKPDAPGLLDVYPPWQRPIYEPSKRRVTFHNGAIAIAYSGAEPDQVRGSNHDTAWADEPASWQYPQETWDNMMLGLRLGASPRVCATTTPRPIGLIRYLLGRAEKKQGVVVTTGSTYENRGNLSDVYYQEVVARYEGTTLAEQEIYGRVLDEMPGALWKRQLIQDTRIAADKVPHLVRIVVAIDPAVTATEESSETGIVACGLGQNGHGYVLRDLSGRHSPDTWARQAIGAYHDLKADRVIGEQNNGGELVKRVIINTDNRVAYKSVYASQGKHTRAEPVAAKYEQGKIHHVGNFTALEDQMCTWTVGEKSPDRMDALVWALTELMLGEQNVDALPISITRESPWRRI